MILIKHKKYFGKSEKEMEQKTSAVCKSMAEGDLEPLVIMMRVLAHPGAGLPRHSELNFLSTFSKTVFFFSIRFI